MNFLIRIATLIVSAGLIALTISGAYSLTGNRVLTVLLGCLVIIQWAAAGHAAIQLRNKSHALPVRLMMAGSFLSLWLAAALVTVPLMSSDLWRSFAANTVGRERFRAEQLRVQERANRVASQYSALGAALAEYREHSTIQATLEDKTGGSCAVSLGPKPGEIHAFRKMDKTSADRLSNQLTPQLNSTAEALRAVEKAEFDAGGAARLAQELNTRIDRLNALARSPMLTSLDDFVADSTSRAGAIMIKGQAFTCVDSTRSLLLQQLSKGVDEIRKLGVLEPVNLLDPTDDRAIAQAMLLLTWAPVLDALPRALRGDKEALDSQLLAKFQVRDTAILSESNQPRIFAWVLEFIFLSLLFLNIGRAKADPGRAARVLAAISSLAIRKVEARQGMTGEVAGAIREGWAEPAPQKTKYVDNASTFPERSVELRAERLAPYYRPYNNRELLVVPLTDFLAVRVARELHRLDLITRLAAGLSTKKLVQDSRLRTVLETVSGGPIPDTTWEVYQVSDPSFLRWLLARPA